MADARTQILVALIGVAGVLGAALIANPDILRSSDPTPAVDAKGSSNFSKTEDDSGQPQNVAAAEPAIAPEPEPSVPAAVQAAVAPTSAELREGLRLSKGDPAPDSSVRPVSIWLALPSGSADGIRSVRYEFYHSTFKSPKLAEPGNPAFVAKWSGYGCINDASVIATLHSGDEVRAPFDLCDLWNNGRLTSL